jgi:type III restriction enzyme
MRHISRPASNVDDVGDWLQKKYPFEFGGDKLLIIHTDRSGDVSKKDLDKARKISREIDDEKSPVNCIVSVLMLREGWDVQSVTVIVGLRPYTSKANILPEQTVGRGLRLMFRGATGYIERVDVIGNKTRRGHRARDVQDRRQGPYCHDRAGP